MGSTLKHGETPDLFTGRSSLHAQRTTYQVEQHNQCQHSAHRHGANGYQLVHAEVTPALAVRVDQTPGINALHLGRTHIGFTHSTPQVRTRIRYTTSLGVHVGNGIGNQGQQQGQGHQGQERPDNNAGMSCACFFVMSHYDLSF